MSQLFSKRTSTPILGTGTITFYWMLKWEKFHFYCTLGALLLSHRRPKNGFEISFRTKVRKRLSRKFSMSASAMESFFISNFFLTFSIQIYMLVYFSFFFTHPRNIGVNGDVGIFSLDTDWALIFGNVMYFLHNILAYRIHLWPWSLESIILKIIGKNW